jgi:hypothetical protein
MKCRFPLFPPVVSILLVAFATAPTATAQENTLRLAWEKNMLHISGDAIPGGPLEIWYIEACCRPGGQERDWNETTIPHETKLVEAAKDGSAITLKTVVEDGVEMVHRIEAGAGEVTFEVDLKHTGKKPSEFQWFQPCLRVGGFTGRTQKDYWEKSFIFTEKGIAFLHELPRQEQARYLGGQVYLPDGRKAEDMNPRPLSKIRPANGLIGCVSADGKKLLATAWDQTHELFQGVIICLHNDPHVGGMAPGESKKLRGKLYVMENEPAKLLARYQKDFPAKLDTPAGKADKGK